MLVPVVVPVGRVLVVWLQCLVVGSAVAVGFVGVSDFEFLWNVCCWLNAILCGKSTVSSSMLCTRLPCHIAGDPFLL